MSALVRGVVALVVHEVVAAGHALGRRRGRRLHVLEAGGILGGLVAEEAEGEVADGDAAEDEDEGEELRGGDGLAGLLLV